MDGRKSCIAIKRKVGVDYSSQSEDRLSAIESHISNVAMKNASSDDWREQFEITNISSKLKLLNKGLVKAIPAVYSRDSASLVIINIALEKEIADYAFTIQ